MLSRSSFALIAWAAPTVFAFSVVAAKTSPSLEPYRAADEPGAFAAPGAPAKQAEPPGGIRPEVLETFLRLRIVAAVLDTQAVEGPIPGPTQGLVPVSWLRSRLSAARRAQLVPDRDAWGNPLLYWSDGSGYLVLSLGSGGRAQFDYGAKPPYAHVPRGWAGSDPTDDLLILNSVAYRGPMSLGESLRRAMADMRSIGTACESYSVDTNLYPGPVQPIDTLERVEHILEPIYIRVLPRLDPWGNPFLFWSDTRNYAIVSYGADGRPDYPYAGWGHAEFESLHTGPTTRPSQDLVFFVGQFVQWPNVGFGP